MGFLAIFGLLLEWDTKAGYGEYIGKKIGRQVEEFEIFGRN
jgi:hypothetical protein